MSKHAIVKVAGKRQWILRGLNTGRILGRHDSREEALQQLRAVERSMHGGKPRRSRGRRHGVSRHRIFKLR